MMRNPLLPGDRYPPVCSYGVTFPRENASHPRSLHIVSLSWTLQFLKILFGALVTPSVMFLLGKLREITWIHFLSRVLCSHENQFPGGKDTGWVRWQFQKPVPYWDLASTTPPPPMRNSDLLKTMQYCQTINSTQTRRQINRQAREKQLTH